MADDQGTPATRYVKRGAVVAATHHPEAGETPNGAPIRAGDWVVEHGRDVQEVMTDDAFQQTYQALADVVQ